MTSDFITAVLYRFLPSSRRRFGREQPRQKQISNYNFGNAYEKGPLFIKSLPELALRTI